MDEYYNADLTSWIDAGNTCIFAFEGLGDINLREIDQVENDEVLSKQTSLEHPKWRYGAMMVVTKGHNIVYITRNASTLPDNRPDTKPSSLATTTLDEGVYDYSSGFHPRYDSENENYSALNPFDYDGEIISWKGWYLNEAENDFHSGECGGINIHASGVNPKASKAEANSLGCQTVWAGDYIDFGKKVGFIKNTVVNDWNDTYGVSSFMITRLNPSTGNNIPINVKYILNRDYDCKNDAYEDDSTSNCKNGVFYPISHDDCIETGDYKCTKC